MKKILALSLAFAIFFVPRFHAGAYESDDAVEHYLIVGFDAAAQNTDVIAVVSFLPSVRKLTFLQIPRDTYYDFGGVQNKLNQLYPFVLAGRKDKAAKEEAMDTLRDAVSAMLGVRIDRYVGVAIDDFSAMVDLIGGLPVKLKRDLVYSDQKSGEKKVLSAGEQILNGSAALAFIRYRAGYASGDLGRLDAQKTFISALLSKLASGSSLRGIVLSCLELRESCVTDFPLFQALRFGKRFLSEYSSLDIRYLTLPGEPCMHGGISYYVANKRSSEEAIRSFLCFGTASPDFDAERRLVYPKSSVIMEIYSRNAVNYHVYTDTELRLGS